MHRQGQDTGTETCSSRAESIVKASEGGLHMHRCPIVYHRWNAYGLEGGLKHIAFCGILEFYRILRPTGPETVRYDWRRDEIPE